MSPRSTPDLPTAPTEPRLIAVPLLLQWCVHALVAALLVLAVVHALTTVADSTLVVAVGVVVAVIYAAGPLLRPVREARTAAATWVGILMAAWLVLLVLSADAIWLAFPWFFLLLYLLPWRAGLACVGGVTVVAIAGFAWHQESFNVGTAIGPVLGALVAIATVWGYTSVVAESDRRRALIAELQRTRADLAAAERAAGALTERERLAREIHDTIAQGLSSIQMLLRAAQRTLPDSGPADQAVVQRASVRIEQARETAQDNLSEARRFIAELAPPGLQGRSLPAALRRLCGTTDDRSGVTVTFEERSPQDADIATAVEVALLRIAQSALANVTEHARATRALVTLTWAADDVTLEITDDGIGFDPEAHRYSTPSGGYGLPSMHARSAEIGGSLVVDSSPGAGTTIRVTAPVVAP